MPITWCSDSQCWNWPVTVQLARTLELGGSLKAILGMSHDFARFVDGFKAFDLAGGEFDVQRADGFLQLANLGATDYGRCDVIL